MGSAVLDCTQATVRSQEQDYSPAKHAEQRNQNCLNQILYKDARGRLSRPTTDARVMATDNRNVRSNGVPARTRRVQQLLARVTTGRLMQW